jgi:hypothetical protein
MLALIAVSTQQRPANNGFAGMSADAAGGGSRHFGRPGGQFGGAFDPPKTCACTNDWEECVRNEQSNMPTTFVPLTPATLQQQETTRLECMQKCFTRNTLTACADSTQLKTAWDTMYDCRKKIIESNGWVECKQYFRERACSCSNTSQSSVTPDRPPLGMTRPDSRVRTCLRECQPRDDRMAGVPVHRCAWNSR